jgi:hypothetical protein
VAATILLIAVAIDVIDGQPLKLATSACLLVAALAAALSRVPRPLPVRLLVAAFSAGALALFAYRVIGPGL